MRNRILEIVVFLMDYMRDRTDRVSGSDELSNILVDMGYSEHEISTAYNWFLDQFNNANEEHYSSFPDSFGSTRIFTDIEQRQLNTEARNFILKLLHTGIINEEQMETVLDRILLLADEPIGIEQIKIVISSIIFKDNEMLESQTFTETNRINPQMIN